MDISTKTVTTKVHTATATVDDIKDVALAPVKNTLGLSDAVSTSGRPSRRAGRGVLHRRTPPRAEAGAALGGALKGQRPTALGHHRFQWLSVTAFVGPGTGETVWYRSNGASKPLFAGLLEAFAGVVGAGPSERIVLLLDNAGLHSRPNLAVPDGIRLVYLPPYNPELQPAETFWPLVDEPIVGETVPTLDALVDNVGARCCDLAERRTDISPRTDFAWRPNNHAPA